MILSSKKLTLPTAEQAMPGRQSAMPIHNQHFVTGQPIAPPFAEHLQQAVFGLGCFWGAERKFWQQSGVVSTAVGYCAGLTPNPTYDEVCTGMTGHNEVVLVVFDTAVCTYRELLNLFWTSHNPTQGMGQGNDRGTQYRSGLYTDTEQQLMEAQTSKVDYQQALTAAGFGLITTEVMTAPVFYYAESYHQQYLAKDPTGYCGLGGLGVAMD